MSKSEQIEKLLLTNIYSRTTPILDFDEVKDGLVLNLSKEISFYSVKDSEKIIVNINILDVDIDICFSNYQNAISWMIGFGASYYKSADDDIIIPLLNEYKTFIESKGYDTEPINVLLEAITVPIKRFAHSDFVKGSSLSNVHYWIKTKTRNLLSFNSDGDKFISIERIKNEANKAFTDKYSIRYTEMKFVNVANVKIYNEESINDCKLTEDIINYTDTVETMLNNIERWLLTNYIEMYIKPDCLKDLKVKFGSDLKKITNLDKLIDSYFYHSFASNIFNDSTNEYHRSYDKLVEGIQELLKFL